MTGALTEKTRMTQIDPILRGLVRSCHGLGRFGCVLALSALVTFHEISRRHPHATTSFCFPSKVCYANDVAAVEFITITNAIPRIFCKMRSETCFKQISLEPALGGLGCQGGSGWEDHFQEA